MIDDVVSALCCPLADRSGLTLVGRTLRCAEGHAFDLARQGYANLLPGGADPGTADDAGMVAARERFLATGTYDFLADALAAAARPLVRDPGGLVLDLGAGTGYYLARVLEACAGAVGLAVDLSKYAVRRAARAHPRAGAVVADAWGRLPVATGAVDLILSVFAPRGGDEIARVLTAGGAAIVATPTPRHLAEVVEPLGMLRVEEDKPARLDALLAPRLVRADTRTVERTLSLPQIVVRDLVGMGPSARHLSDGQIADRVTALPEPVTVTASLELATFLRAAAATGPGPR